LENPSEGYDDTNTVAVYNKKHWISVKRQGATPRPIDVELKR
jgi:hypothetical protein